MNWAPVLERVLNYLSFSALVRCPACPPCECAVTLHCGASERSPAAPSSWPIRERLTTVAFVVLLSVVTVVFGRRPAETPALVVAQETGAQTDLPTAQQTSEAQSVRQSRRRLTPGQRAQQVEVVDLTENGGC